MTITIKETQVIEYENLIAQLREQAKQDQNTIIRLENKVTELENLHAACDDVENEVASLLEDKRKLQDECSRLLDKQYEADYKLENWKHRMEKLLKENEQLEKENKVLRDLVKVWA